MVMWISRLGKIYSYMGSIFMWFKIGQLQIEWVSFDLIDTKNILLSS